ncbi:MAG: glycoside hydrolase family 88 protein, partial [Parasporobacterium sp.]|nr:glycoside hydrolase family 88 protein [Parasporobacterium sp.]
LDDVYIGMALIDLYKITRIQRYKRALDSLALYIKNYPTDSQGSFLSSYNAPGGTAVDISSIGTAVPFMMKYSHEFKDLEMETLAVSQIINYLDKGMDDKLILPYHGYNFNDGLKMGIIGWGQAVGMLMMGMSETLYYMDKERSSYEPIRMGFRRVVDKVEAYQNTEGLYHWQLSAKDGPVDTGATAMILSAISQSIDDKVLIGIHKTRMMRGVETLKTMVLKEGKINGAMARAEGFNNYPIITDAYPWALGPALSLFVRLEDELVQEENISSIDWEDTYDN